MHDDARLAHEAFETGKIAWVRLTPEVVMDLGGRDVRKNPLLKAVREFQPVDRAAGQDAARWLRDEALDDYGQTVTHVMLSERAIEGYYALCAAEVVVTAPPDEPPAGSAPDISYDTLQPASRIAWIARRGNGKTPGAVILGHAVATALRVGELQATVALVIDAYDEESAQLWEDRGFHRSAEETHPPEPDAPIRLWKPLRIDESAKSPSGVRGRLSALTEAIGRLRQGD